MSTLEELLLQAAEKGLTHLTLYPVPSQDGKRTYWAARATPSTTHQYVHDENKSPVEALANVLLALPKAPRRQGAKDPNLYGSGVTAAVKPRFDEVSPPLSEYPQRAAQMAKEAGIELEEQAPATLDPELENWLPKP